MSRGMITCILIGLAGLVLPAISIGQPMVVQKVESQASQLTEAVNQGEAESNWRALGKEVKRAIKEGHGKELVETNDPNIAGAVLLAAKGRSVVTSSEPSTLPKERGAPKRPPGAPRAQAAGCYGRAWDQDSWVTAVGTIAWVYVSATWCGIPNQQITWWSGPTVADWEWGIYCLAGHGTNGSWDQPPRWIHAANWGSVGIRYPWGCAGLRGIKAVIRISASGYWDTYNDYGF